jgi:hypothetical protein
MLGAILNRTVLLPPIPSHYDLPYGGGDAARRKQLDANWKGQEEVLNNMLAFSKEVFRNGSRYRRMAGIYDVGFFNVSVMDLFAFYHDICSGHLSLRSGCGGVEGGLQVVGSGVPPDYTHAWKTIADVVGSLGVGHLGETPVLAVGSTFKMTSLNRLDVSGGPPLLQEVLTRLQFTSIPFSRPILDAAKRVSGAVGSYAGSFCAAHLRMPDNMDWSNGWTSELDLVTSYVQWLLKQLEVARVPDNSTVYVATNLPAGCEHNGFNGLRSRYHCVSLGMDDLMCKAGLCDGLPENSSLPFLTGMGKGDLMALIDKQVCVSADEGFWPSDNNLIPGKCFQCTDNCPPHVSSTTFANDIIWRRAGVCKPSCADDSASDISKRANRFNDTLDAMRDSCLGTRGMPIRSPPVMPGLSPSAMPSWPSPLVPRVPPSCPPGPALAMLAEACA